MAEYLLSLDNRTILAWTHVLLGCVGAAGLIIGFLSFCSPPRSIRLYQIIMEFFNWRVEPINLPREIRNTKWLGLVMVLLSLAIVLILMSGCARDIDPWGYRSSANLGIEVETLEAGTRHNALGILTDEKIGLINRRGLPTYIGTERAYNETDGREYKDWIYLDQKEMFYFFEDNGALLKSDPMSALDLASFQGYLQPNMTKEQVFRVEGKPTKIDYSTQVFGATEKWIYKRYTGSLDALYFQNDRLILWRRETEESFLNSNLGSNQ